MSYKTQGKYKSTKQGKNQEKTKINSIVQHEILLFLTRYGIYRHLQKFYDQ